MRPLYHQSENKRLSLVCDPPRAQRRRQRRRLESKTWPPAWMVFTLCFFFSVLMSVGSGANVTRSTLRSYCLLLFPPPSSLRCPGEGAPTLLELFCFFSSVVNFSFRGWRSRSGLVFRGFSFINLVCEFSLSSFCSF